MSHSGGLAGLAVGGRKEASHVKSPRLARGGPGASAPTRSKSPSAGSATSPAYACAASRPTALARSAIDPIDPIDRLGA